jgi:hypothetical protein
MHLRWQARLSSGRDRVSLLLLLGTLGLGVHGVIEWADRAHRLADAEHRALLLALRGAALAAVATALALAWRARARLFRGETGAVGLGLRGLAGGLLIAWAAGSAAQASLADDKTSVASAFWSVLIAFVALWTLYALLAPERFFADRRRWLDALAWNLLLTLVLAEIAVSLWAWRNPSPFLWDEGSVVASLEARRLSPGSFFLGTPANRGGYHDEEFHPPRGDDERVVAVLADSFGLGVVPHAHHFTSVAERRLAERLPGRRVALHNFGVAGIGLPEYAWLLEHEVPATSPQQVLLCVFVGNDISSYTRRRGSYYSFQRFVVYELLRRLLGVSRATGAGGALDPQALGSEQAPPLAPPGEEEPSFEVERFLEIERDRMEITDARSDEVAQHYRRFFTHLAAIHESAGPRLRVAVIPDQFQVDDELWQQLMAGEPSPDERFVRDLPQRRIAAFCAERDIACLDLLAPLRDAQREQPVYHLRDTHWNARGNRVAGEAIADFLAAGLADGSSRPR